MGETSAFLLLGAVIILILMAVGVFIATLVYFQRAQNKKQRDASPPPQEPIREPEPSPPPAPALETPTRPGEVMRVIRDEHTGSILVEVEGQSYGHIREISDAQTGRRVLWAIADLIRFTGGMAANPQAVRSIAPEKETPSVPSAARPEPKQTRASAEQAVPSLGSTPQPTMGTPPMSSLGTPSTPPPPAITNQPAGGRRKSSVVQFFRRGFDSAGQASEAQGPRSFIDEIEEILQGYIRNLPQPLSQTVHIQTGEDGMLEIEVGVNRYSNPDDVRDPEIRKLIKAAVAEWEKR